MIAIDTLYISDLDGTLLGADASLEEPERSRLAALLGAGLPLSIATGRSHRSALGLLGDLPFRLPVILLNGSLLYDIPARSAVDIRSFEPACAKACVDILDRHDLAPVLYTMDAEDEFRIYYRSMRDGMYDLHYGRQIRSGDSRYRRVEEYGPHYGERCFFVATLAELQALEAPVRELAAAGLPHDYYRDIYTGGYFLECCMADKGVAALDLKRRTGAKRIVAFGDGLNDLPLMRVADTAIAVQGACPEILAKADEVIGPHERHSVLAYLEAEWKSP